MCGGEGRVSLRSCVLSLVTSSQPPPPTRPCCPIPHGTLYATENIQILHNKRAKLLDYGFGRCLPYQIRFEFSGGVALAHTMTRARRPSTIGGACARAVQRVWLFGHDAPLSTSTP
jgi:hypothetical protein